MSQQPIVRVRFRCGIQMNKKLFNPNLGIISFIALIVFGYKQLIVEWVYLSLILVYLLFNSFQYWECRLGYVHKKSHTKVQRHNL